jgi:hypothetical protein
MDHNRQQLPGKGDKVLKKPISWIAAAAGRIDISSQTKPNTSNTLKLDKALRLANQKIKEGFPEEA